MKNKVLKILAVIISILLLGVILFTLVFKPVKKETTLYINWYQ